MSISQQSPRDQQRQDLAADILLHMASDDELMGQFLSATGLDPADLRQMARDGSAGIAMLDFLAEDDLRLQTFAAATGHRVQDLMRLRTLLDGPGAHGWSID
ncbi:MAG: DUF3572 family protein [Paracoccus sp. (in: a-proteobacteria)]|nr:DUF3572 family protein [Paracoccus sp. (in: a-proteobacteria)]